jgi:hypothetical protein
MALINCKECNKEISDSVKSCPHCGFKLKKSISKGKLIVVISLMAIAISVVGKFKYDEYKIISSVKSKIESTLKDPSSVQYKNIKVSNKKKDENGINIKMVCLEFNAKNAMGGYTGFVKDSCTYITEKNITVSCSRQLLEEVVQIVKNGGEISSEADKVLNETAKQVAEFRISKNCNF